MKRLRLAPASTPTVPARYDNTDLLLDSLQQAYASGKSPRQARAILNISKAEFQQLTVLIRTVNVNPSSSIEAYTEYVDAVSKFELCCQYRLSQLDEMLKPMTKVNPIDGFAENPSGARRLVRAMSKIDEMILQSKTLLLQSKIKLGLIDAIPDQPVRQQYLPGETLPQDSLFTSSNVREAWRQRMLSNGNGHRN